MWIVEGMEECKKDNIEAKIKKEKVKTVERKKKKYCL
jgi:hypothetical protein